MEMAHNFRDIVSRCYIFQYDYKKFFSFFLGEYLSNE